MNKVKDFQKRFRQQIKNLKVGHSIHTENLSAPSGVDIKKRQRKLILKLAKKTWSSLINCFIVTFSSTFIFLEQFQTSRNLRIIMILFYSCDYLDFNDMLCVLEILPIVYTSCGKNINDFLLWEIWKLFFQPDSCLYLYIWCPQYASLGSHSQIALCQKTLLFSYVENRIVKSITVYYLIKFIMSFPLK